MSKCTKVHFPLTTLTSTSILLFSSSNKSAHVCVLVIASPHSKSSYAYVCVMECIFAVKLGGLKIGMGGF